MIQSPPAILKDLHHIKHQNHSTPKAASEASGLLSKLNTFEFKFMLVFWKDLLKRTYILSNYLQKESLDVNTAVDLIDIITTLIRQLRTDEAFDTMEITAKKMARESNATTEFVEERVCKRKRHFVEDADDDPIQNSRSRFKTEVYFYILDISMGQFENRFSDFKEMG